ncbi:hypothetical protein [Halomarina litorea]|uniref:hypothetical protein n=1 Tax=Halomarina litorea TaxID=2961595 RepID=UPI0020C3997A|nr:hypothetical protein [Halomarina sp. BCD28]
MSQDSATIGDHDEYDYPDHLDRHPAVRVVASRWKHAVVAVVLAVTAWALYNVAGGWSLDATVFAIATAAFVGYSTVTLRTDLE